MKEGTQVAVKQSGGIAEVTLDELVTQLRGEAGPRQVDGARIALQENGGGIVGVEEATAVVNLFARQ